MRYASVGSLATLAFALSQPACGGETPPPAVPPPVTSAAPAASTAALEPVSPAANAAPAEPAKPAGPASVAKYTGLAAPETVLYDADGDRYLVSNVNGKPADKDNNGFISALSPDGAVTSLKWIEAGKNKVKLDAPKGLAIAGGVLYVADIDVVRKFDLKTGAPKGDITIPGSTFLNGVASGPDGRVYVSDSGIKFTEKGVEPTKTEAVYVIEKGKVKPLAKGSDLGAPNGLVVAESGVVVVTFGSGEVYRLDQKGEKKDSSKPPAGALDGVISLGDSLLVSSWQASAVFRGKLGGTFETVLSDQKSPAGIGYDTKRSRLLVPRMMEDTVEAFDLK